MISYFVRYDGQSADPEGFMRHYRTDHAKLLRQFDGIQGLTLHTPVDWNDPFPVQRGGLSLLAQMTFDSAEALNRGLASDARRIAREDFESFPDFDGQIFHQALQARRKYFESQPLTQFPKRHRGQPKLRRGQAANLAKTA